MDTLINDLRYALRQMRRAPTFTLFVVATLAIGIGASTTIFSALDAILLRPLYRDEAQLMKLSGAFRGRGDDWSVSLPNAVDWAKLNHTFSDIGYYQRGSITVVGNGTPERVQIASVSPNLFSILGVAPLIGRAFLPDEATPDAPRVLILNHSFWQTRFGADRSVVGKSLMISGRPAMIVGVMPPGFDFPSGQLGGYMPLRARPTDWSRASGGLSVLGRLRSGVSLGDAQRDMDAVSERLTKQYSENAELTAHLTPFRAALVGDDLSKGLWLLCGAVGLVLLIACVNVANLLLARAADREREVAVRAAIGAGRSRVVRQLITEGLLLALVGGVAGLALASVGVQLLPQLIPADAELPRNMSIDARVLWFSIVLTLFTGLTFSALPAAKATATDLSILMGVRSARTSARQSLRRGVLVVVEVALAVVLMVAAGLVLHGLTRLMSTNPGFRTTNLLTLRVPMDAKYRSADQALDFEQRVLSNIRALADVQSASIADFVPMSGTNNFNEFYLEGRSPDKSDNIGTVLVGPDYLRTMGIPLVAGREFDEHDVRTAPGVALVNKALADRYWPGQNPIGKRVLVNWEGGKQPNWRTVVGVFGNVLHDGLATDKKAQRTEIYLPIAQLSWLMNDVTVIVRTRQDPVSAAGEMRNAVWAADPSIGVYDIKTMTRLVDETSDVLLARILASVIGVFGSIALLLAAIGLYGVVSYSVAQRTFEIGVRSALGADAGMVLRMVMAQGIKLVVAGLVIGGAAALLVARVMQSLLHGVGAADPFAFGATSLVLAAVALAATAIPALRAARIAPSLALRSD